MESSSKLQRGDGYISLRMPGISAEQRKAPKDEVPEEHVLLVFCLKPAGNYSIST